MKRPNKKNIYIILVIIAFLNGFVVTTIKGFNWQLFVSVMLFAIGFTISIMET